MFCFLLNSVKSSTCRLKRVICAATVTDVLSPGTTGLVARSCAEVDEKKLLYEMVLNLFIKLETTRTTKVVIAATGECTFFY